MTKPDQSEQTRENSTEKSPNGEIASRPEASSLPMPPPVAANHANLCVYVLSAVLCSVPLGLDFGTTGQLMETPSYLLRHGITAKLATPVIFTFHLGAMCGCCGVLWGKVPQRVGYVNSLRIGFAVYQMGALVLILSLVTPCSYAYIIVARFCYGLACGMLGVVAPILISRICVFTSRKHDFLYACHLTTGIVMVGSGSVFFFDVNAEVFVLALQTLLAPLAIALSLTVPSVDKQPKEALVKLAKNTQNEEVYMKALEIMMASREKPSSMDNSRSRLMACSVLMALQQLTGVSFFFYFGKLLFESVVQSPSVHRYSALFLGLCSLAGTLVSYPLMKCANLYKGLLFGSLANTAMLTAFTILGLLLSAGHDCNGAIGYCMLVAACVFQFVFASSWGPYVGVVCVEISRASSAILSVSVLVGWATNVLVMATMPALVRTVGYGAISIFALFGALSAAISWTLEQRFHA